MPTGGLCFFFPASWYLSPSLLPAKKKGRVCWTEPEKIFLECFKSWCLICPCTCSAYFLDGWRQDHQFFSYSTCFLFKASPPLPPQKKHPCKASHFQHLFNVNILLLLGRRSVPPPPKKKKATTPFFPTLPWSSSLHRRLQWSWLCQALTLVVSANLGRILFDFDRFCGHESQHTQKTVIKTALWCAEFVLEDTHVLKRLK